MYSKGLEAAIIKAAYTKQKAVNKPSTALLSQPFTVSSFYDFSGKSITQGAEVAPSVATLQICCRKRVARGENKANQSKAAACAFDPGRLQQYNRPAVRGQVEGDRMAQVTLKNLTKRFKDVVAVEDVNLEIRDGEFLVLVGPSGCGKTTTLRMIAGLEEATEGTIYIGDKLVNDVSPKDRDIAMVFQNYALYPHMTVYDNMAFALKLRKFPREEIDRRVKAAAEMLELDQLLKRRPKELSGGQRQRVALGRAIVREPAVFLMDEPLSNLDAKVRVQTRAELIKLHRRLGVTTIYVTHDQTEAMTMGDRIVVMNAGRIQQVDTPLNLYNKPANRFVAGFIGSPAMNFLEVTLEERPDGVWVNAGDFALKLVGEGAEKARPHVGERMIFGIRPEHIYSKDLTPVAPEEGNTQTAHVDVIEPMGAEMVAYIELKSHSLVSSLSSDSQVEEGKPAEFVFELKKAHLFFKESGEALF